jgi:hypothetical protein
MDLNPHLDQNLCVGLSAYYGPTGTDEESKQVLRKALEIGCTFWSESFRVFHLVANELAHSGQRPYRYC